MKWLQDESWDEMNMKAHFFKFPNLTYEGGLKLVVNVLKLFFLLDTPNHTFPCAKSSRVHIHY